LFILLALILLLGAAPVHAAATGLNPSYGKVGLAFEQNNGQLDPRVKFLARTGGYSLFLTGDEAVMRFTTPKSAVVRMKFLGQKRNARVEGLDVLSGTTNYLTGDRSLERTNIRSYKKVRYSGIYRGIDVEYRGNGRTLEYDFLIQPGADPRKIRIGFSGVSGLSLNSSGDLVLNADGESIVQKKPYVYQDVNGERKTIDSAYTIRGKDAGFNIGKYDRTRPLIIDPELVYSTFFGGSGADLAFGIQVDSTGAAYIAGATDSTDFPVQSAAQASNKGGSSDAFVFKLDPTGTQIVYATYIGGSGADEAHSIAVDAGGNAYITGFTQSNDFPVVNGFQRSRAGGQDAYILKLNSFGTGIVFSSFLGGTGDDRGMGIALDAANNAYITGVTSSNDFPAVNAYQKTNAGGFADGFITKVSAGGSVVYSTFAGGIGNDNPMSIAVDSNGAAYVTGWTTSINFPMVNAFQSKFGGFDVPVGTDDVFVLKLNPAGTALEYSTYVGGTGSDEATRIVVDSEGSAYVTGYTGSLNFPTVKPYQVLLAELSGLDAFVFKLAPDGKSLIFSTYFGGFQNESGTGIAVDATGAVYISGYTTSFDLPTANQTQSFIGGDRDAFVAKFDPAGTVLVFSTFLGGTGIESATNLTIDSAGNAYVLGFTNSGDFPLANALQGTVAGGEGQDLFISKLNVQDIVSSSQFQVAPAGTASVITKGTRSDAVFGYAVADPINPGSPLTGLAIISRKQNGATVSEVGIPAPALSETGRLFVDVSSTGRSVLSIANPHDEDVTVDVFYTNQDGETNQFANFTVKAHEHFSRFVTDDPLLVFEPGTLNYTSSLPVAATSFFTVTNEAGELLISRTPIVDPIAHTAAVGNRTVTIPELADGGGWKSDVILVNTSEDQMNGEVRFFSAGSPSEPGASMFVGIGDDNVPQPAVEFNIPPRGFQKVATAGSAASSEVPFSLLRGTSIPTPGAGAFQVTGWATADSTNPEERLNGLQIIEYRQLGITQSQTGIVAPVLRQSGRFFAETTGNARSYITIINPDLDNDASVDFYLTDDAGTSSDPVTVAVPAGGQFALFLADQPINLGMDTQRTVTFSASSPVFVTALRFFTNERSDSILSVIPIHDIDPDYQPVTIPHFADGAGWKTQVVLVNNTDDELRGEIRFWGQGGGTELSQGAIVGTDNLGDSYVFEYDVQPRSFYRLQTNGLAENLTAGSVQIVPFLGYPTPAAYAVVSDFIVDQAATDAAGEIRGNTIFETSVEGQLPATNLRFYAEGAGDFDAAKPKSTRTSIAIANPSDSTATVRLELRSFDNTLLGTSAPITIPPNGQFAAYLPQVPGFESVRAPFQGIVSLTVLSGAGVTAGSFRILYNERPDYLVTTTGPLNEQAGIPGRLMFPYLTDSTGYTTQFILISPPGAQGSSGVLRFMAADGAPLQIDTLTLGSIQVVPFEGSATPHAHVVLYHRDSGVLTSIIGVEGETPDKIFRMYAEAIGDFESGVAGSTRSGVALANPSESPATVTLEIRNPDGTLMRRSQPFNVPADGQVALFLNQAPGFETLTVPYSGILTVTAISPQGITATAFRTVYNERGELIYTTTGPLIENAENSPQLIFPHIAEGGGYTTQFIVIGGISGQANAGVIRFFNGDGNPLNVTLAPR
jgi:hypothetical protein